jgi:hypothetical protein
MVNRPTFLTTRFGGYFHRDVPPEDAELTHVGPGTPCGEYLRRYWQPVCFTDELQDLPLPVTILGEELVVFRIKKAWTMVELGVCLINIHEHERDNAECRVQPSTA